MRKASFALLALLLLIGNLYANFLINDHLISPRASDYIEKMAVELKAKTGINGYVIATHDNIQRGESVYTYINKYSNLKKPFVAIVFAPNSKRIHVVSNPKELSEKLDKGKILDYAIKIIASKDSNSLQSKYDVGLVQSFSELADEVAKSKGVKLDSTIKEKSRWIVKGLNYIIIIGSIIVLWIYFVNPIIQKKKKIG